MGIGREKTIPDDVRVSGRTKCLGNEGEPTDIHRSGAREYGSNASLWQRLKLHYEFSHFSQHPL
ncbi:hypothetical protein SESBI_20528 [Sesbania bispinosa]|nr:hypothetical protein SESBI_20528 [Sesbania bispinosa]